MDFTIVTAKYDTLEAKIKEKLDILFNEKKIRKEEYAEIYTNLMNRTLGEIINSFLIDAQISKINKENQLMDEKIITEQNNHTIQSKQVQKMNEEITLLQKQILTEVKRTNLMQSEIDLNSKRGNELIAKERLLYAQKDLTVEQKDNEHTKGFILQKEIIQKDAEYNLTVAKRNQINEEITMLQIQEQTESARKDMIIRQTQGFDDNIRIKLFESSMNAWAMMFGSGFLLDSNGDPLKPQFITNDKTTCLWNELIVHSNTSTNCQG